MNAESTNFGDRANGALCVPREKIVGDTVERTFTDYYSGGHKYASIVTDNKTGDVLDCMLIGDREFIAYMIGDKSAEWSGW